MAVYSSSGPISTIGVDDFDIHVECIHSSLKKRFIKVRLIDFALGVFIDPTNIRTI